MQADSIREGLPAQHPEEPEGLRSDILDELTDHLECAQNRQRHKTKDHDKAWSAVLNEFGDPVSIARQLWFDNMKERIMRDKVLLFSAVLAGVAYFMAVILCHQKMWFSIGPIELVLLSIAFAIATLMVCLGHSLWRWAVVGLTCVTVAACSTPADPLSTILLGVAFFLSTESVEARKTHRSADDTIAILIEDRAAGSPLLLPALARRRPSLLGEVIQ